MDPHRVDVSREELLQQSRELAGALLDLEARKEELATLNASSATRTAASWRSMRSSTSARATCAAPAS